MTTSQHKANRIVVAAEPVTALQHLDLLEKMIRQFNRDGEYQPHDVFRTLGDIRSAIELRERQVQTAGQELREALDDMRRVTVEIRNQAIRENHQGVIMLTATVLGY